MQTDEPLINAIFNQLVQTGFVSNRLRMVFANYLSQKGLPWLVAKQAFDMYLIDIFQASNLFNWQFAYNLTLGRSHNFSIERQIKKFDKNSDYIKRWTP